MRCSLCLIFVERKAYENFLPLNYYHTKYNISQITVHVRTLYSIIHNLHVKEVAEGLTVTLIFFGGLTSTATLILVGGLTPAILTATCTTDTVKL